jgi:thiol-disulfide isomerase/thioredoxin
VAVTGKQQMRRIILYTKPGCHLCDDVHELLLALGDETGAKLRIEQVNILEDPALYARYRYAIPVIAVDPDGGGPTLYAPINRSALRQALGLEEGPVVGPDARGSERTRRHSEDKV